MVVVLFRNTTKFLFFDYNIPGYESKRSRERQPPLTGQNAALPRIASRPLPPGI
jgi:hypothetical protein